ncbi:hypothetical protein [Candidatus Magnetomonas plexicatena]|uniref:hypothetical protein n=1 Tax=Candidatus Magnetomonas plexicatena TaxID=2552947 RepID=UPI001104BF3B|nr:hypothetical protein E2O03_007645 [Nitrospirales bacterium LBB_01]
MKASLIRNKFLIIFCLIFFTASYVFADEVFIRAGNTGRGITKPVGNNCYVITPKDIVGNSNRPVTVYFADNRKIVGFPVSSDLGDIAVIVLENVSGGCYAYSVPSDLGSLADTMKLGVLKVAGENGDLATIPVRVTRNATADTIHIIADSAEYVSITPNLIGSAFYFSDRDNQYLAGILLTADTTGGTVLKIDAIDQIMASFFGILSPAQVLQHPSIQTPSPVLIPTPKPALVPAPPPARILLPTPVATTNPKPAPTPPPPPTPSPQPTPVQPPKLMPPPSPPPSAQPTPVHPPKPTPTQSPMPHK